MRTTMVEYLLHVGSGDYLTFYADPGISDDDLTVLAEEVLEAHGYDPDCSADLANLYRCCIDAGEAER